MSEVITYEKRGKIKKILFDNFPESDLVRAEIEDIINSIVDDMSMDFKRIKEAGLNTATIHNICNKNLKDGKS